MIKRCSCSEWFWVFYDETGLWDGFRWLVRWSETFKSGLTRFFSVPTLWNFNFKWEIWSLLKSPPHRRPVNSWTHTQFQSTFHLIPSGNFLKLFFFLETHIHQNPNSNVIPRSSDKLFQLHTHNEWNNSPVSVSSLIFQSYIRQFIGDIQIILLTHR